MANMMSPEQFKARAKEAKVAGNSTNLPYGQYPCLMSKTWHGVTKVKEVNGVQKGGTECISITWKVIQGPLKDREQSVFYNIGNPDSNVPMAMLMQDIDKLGYDSEKIDSSATLDVYLATMQKNGTMVLLGIAEGKNPAFPKITIDALISAQATQQQSPPNGNDVPDNTAYPTGMDVPDQVNNADTGNVTASDAQPSTVPDEDDVIDIGSVIMFKDATSGAERKGKVVGASDDGLSVKVEVRTIKGPFIVEVAADNILSKVM